MNVDQIRKGTKIVILPCEEIPDGKILQVSKVDAEMVQFTDWTWTDKKNLVDGSWGVVEKIVP
jgi:hypothetical protein